jgi:Zn-finger nucleic acid-binding protein
MNCPVCKTRTLTTQNLKPDLVSWKCDTCGGQWVNSFQFWKWLEESKHEKTAAAPG